MTIKLSNAIFAVLLCLFIALSSGCSTANKRADLMYEKSAAFSGGSGALFIAKPVDKSAGVIKPSGDLILGAVKDKDIDIVTKDKVGEWVMLALMQEFYAAGYNVKTVDALPDNVSKGITVEILKISANQTDDLAVVTTSSELKVSVKVWKDGKNIKALTYDAGNSDKGIDRSAGPITSSLRKALTDLMIRLGPEVVSALEQ